MIKTAVRLLVVALMFTLASFAGAANIDAQAPLASMDEPANFISAAAPMPGVVLLIALGATMVIARWRFDRGAQGA